jgi:Ca2+-binding RTX toxin-like protein
MYMDFDPDVQTIYRDFAMDPSKEYYLQVIEIRAGFPGGALLSGRYVVVPTDQASGPVLPDGTVEVRGGVFETNWLRPVSITGETDAPVGGGAGSTGQSLSATTASVTLVGGPGNDTVTGASGNNYLRGSDGDDVLRGGTGFDDANGNAGRDTVSGGAGDDWAVGGKDNDLLLGDAGGDIVWGNLGNDTCEGGDGADQVRGGQGDDSVSGGAGNDYVSGDRGNDTINGGAGADIFHGSQDAGIDRVLDFKLAEGDRVMLDPGTTYSLGQVGADAVLDMGGGHQMILVGVQASTLTGNWIFAG